MGIRKKLFQVCWKLQSVIAPTLRYSQYLYEDVLKSNVDPTFVWLDLGSGHQLLPAWRSSEEKVLAHSCKTTVGLDYDFKALSMHKTILLKVRGDASQLPFRDGAFDLVTANMVVEHLDSPELQFREIHRVLKPSGLFIFHTPNIYGYTTILARLTPNFLKKKLIYLLEDRKEEDVFRTYYRANSEFKVRQLANSIGFRIQEIKIIVSSAQFAVIPPLVILELIWLRLLMTRPLRMFRTNIIAICEKRLGKT